MRIGKCYVCNKSATQKERRIIISPTLWRHEKCCIGSFNWLKSKRAKNSEFTTLFLENKKGF